MAKLKAIRGRIAENWITSTVAVITGAVTVLQLVSEVLTSEQFAGIVAGLLSLGQLFSSDAK